MKSSAVFIALCLSTVCADVGYTDCMKRFLQDVTSVAGIIAPSARYCLQRLQHDVANYPLEQYSNELSVDRATATITVFQRILTGPFTDCLRSGRDGIAEVDMANVMAYLWMTRKTKLNEYYRERNCSTI